MNASELEKLMQYKANLANQIAGHVAAGEPVPGDLLNDWKRADNEVSARLDGIQQWDVEDES